MAAAARDSTQKVISTTKTGTKHETTKQSEQNTRKEHTSFMLVTLAGKISFRNGRKTSDWYLTGKCAKPVSCFGGCECVCVWACVCHRETDGRRT